MSEIKKIAVIGMGHIGKAVINGLLRGGVKRSNLFLSNESDKNVHAVKKSDIIFICVKPAVVKEVICGIRPFLTDDKIIISVAACVSLKLLERYFNSKKLKIMRIMPNIPVAYGKGVVGFIDSPYLSGKERTAVLKILGNLGLTIVCKNEAMLDKLSLISGCGTGYAGYFMRNLEKVAENYGFSSDDRKRIILATFEGAIRHIMETKISFEGLVEKVATKGGITEEVINNLDKRNYFQNLKAGIDAGYAKIKKISNNLEGE